MKKPRTKNKLRSSARKLLTLPKRKMLPYGIVAALVAVVGVAGVAFQINKANSHQQVPSTPVAQAKPEDTPIAQASPLVPAPVAPAPSTAKPQTSAAGPGPTTGNAYKLNKDGQMPTVSNKRLIVSPSVVTYSRMSNSRAAFTVATEDGRATSMPSGIVNGCCFVATNEYTTTPKSSWNVFLDMGAVHGNTASQSSYVVPLQIIADDGRGNEVRYSGSVTVVIAP